MISLPRTRSLALALLLLGLFGASPARGSEVEPLLRRARQLREARRSAAALHRLETALHGGLQGRPPSAALHNLRGDLLVDLGRFGEAGEAYALAHGVATREGDLERAAITANDLGLLLSICAHTVYGRPAQGGRCELIAAERWFARAIALRLERGDDRGALKTSNNLGMVRFAVGHYEDAEESYARSAALARRLQDFSHLRLAEASRALALLMATYGYQICQEGVLEGKVDGFIDQHTLGVASRHLRASHRAARAAGEPAEIVCQTFGRYERICWTLEKRLPELAPRD